MRLKISCHNLIKFALLHINHIDYFITVKLNETHTPVEFIVGGRYTSTALHFLRVSEGVDN